MNRFDGCCIDRLSRQDLPGTTSEFLGKNTRIPSCGESLQRKADHPYSDLERAEERNHLGSLVICPLSIRTRTICCGWGVTLRDEDPVEDKARGCFCKSQDSAICPRWLAGDKNTQSDESHK